MRKESNMINHKSNQTSGISNILTGTSDDNGAYLPIDFSKPPKFNATLSVSSETC